MRAIHSAKDEQVAGFGFRFSFASLALLLEARLSKSAVKNPPPRKE
jgi:hypothetical protein